MGSWRLLGFGGKREGRKRNFSRKSSRCPLLIGSRSATSRLSPAPFGPTKDCCSQDFLIATCQFYWFIVNERPWGIWIWRNDIGDEGLVGIPWYYCNTSQHATWEWTEKNFFFASSFFFFSLLKAFLIRCKCKYKYMFVTTYSPLKLTDRWIDRQATKITEGGGGARLGLPPSLSFWFILSIWAGLIFLLTLLDVIHNRKDDLSSSPS